MSFAQETELPPIFQHIINYIEDNDGHITTKEFRQLLYTIRINKDDIKEIRKWLKENGYIEIKHGKKSSIHLTRQLPTDLHIIFDTK